MLEANDSDVIALYCGERERDEVYTYEGPTIRADVSQFSRSYTEVDDSISDIGKLEF